MSRVFARLWRLPFRYAIWLALPFQIIVVWVAFQGWLGYERERSFDAKSGPRPTFVLDRWVYVTRRELQRSLCRALAPPMPTDNSLETIKLTIAREDLARLNVDLPESGKTNYYKGTFETADARWNVKLRYLGDNYWHWLYPQKSWKVKSQRNDPIRDRRFIALKNPHSVTGIEDVLANEIAQEIGVLAPDVRPIKLVVNNAYAGLYLWWDLADESMLRRARRMPGSVYSGDGGAPLDEEYGACNIYKSEQYWVKDASRNAEHANDRKDIALLIDAINGGDPVALQPGELRAMESRPSGLGGLAHGLVGGGERAR